MFSYLRSFMQRVSVGIVPVLILILIFTVFASQCYVKRDLHLWQKRPTPTSKEAYSYGKRDLLLRQKRPSTVFASQCYVLCHDLEWLGVVTTASMSSNYYSESMSSNCYSEKRMLRADS